MKQVSIEIIHKCLNKCLHCSSYSDINCTKKIDVHKVKELVDSISNLNVKVLSISGGEPFLHEELMDIVEYSKAKNVPTYIYTSGIMLNKYGEVDSISKDLLNKLHDISIDKLIFDIPAIDESIYDHFMGTSGYQSLAFESLNRAKEIGIYTEIHFVPTKINRNEIDSIIEFAKRIGIDRVSFLGLVPHGRATANKENLVLDETENMELKAKLKKIENNKIRIGIPLQMDHSEYSCYAGVNKLCIRYDGKVFGCEAFKYIELADENNRIISPDSIYEFSLEDIYSGSEYLKFERKFIEQRMENRNCSEKCPVQRMMRKVSGL